MTRLLQDLLTTQAERRPDAVALALGDERVTYGSLHDFSDRLAGVLQASGCRPGDRVCLLSPKSPRLVAAMLGTLKAGGLYVPLDSSSPSARLARIVNSCENSVLLAAGVAPSLLEELKTQAPAGTAVIGWLDRDVPPGMPDPTFTLADVERAPARYEAVRAAPDSGAHILFTSGSTGQPKGVVVRHSSVLAFADWGVRFFGMTPEDQVSCQPPFHFDLSTFDLYGALSVGAALHLVPVELNRFPDKLADFIRQKELTQWFSVPSVLSFLLKSGVIRQGDFPALRRILSCGEVMPAATLQGWVRLVPHATYTNLYGPTEAAIASTYYRVPEGPVPDGPVPIGQACPGEVVKVFSSDLREVPHGEIGDIYIGGVGLSPGYWRDDEKTKLAFISLTSPDGTATRWYKTGDLGRVDAQGVLYFLGRADSQIKSRGYRIELGDIEAGLDSLGCLKECAVVPMASSEFDGVAICCAMVPNDASVTPAVVRKRLRRVLPDYMLPTRWLAMNVLPKNANGKIDRPALKAAFERGDDRRVPGPAPAR